MGHAGDAVPYEHRVRPIPEEHVPLLDIGGVLPPPDHKGELRPRIPPPPMHLGRKVDRVLMEGPTQRMERVCVPLCKLNERMGHKVLVVVYTPSHVDGHLVLGM